MLPFHVPQIGNEMLFLQGATSTPTSVNANLAGSTHEANSYPNQQVQNQAASNAEPAFSKAPPTALFGQVAQTVPATALATQPAVVPMGTPMLSLLGLGVPAPNAQMLNILQPGLQGMQALSLNSLLQVQMQAQVQAQIQAQAAQAAQAAALATLLGAVQRPGQINPSKVSSSSSRAATSHNAPSTSLVSDPRVPEQATNAESAADPQNPDDVPSAHDPNRKYEGYVRSWDSDSGFGFIVSSESKRVYNKDIFLHKSEIGSEPDLYKLRRRLTIQDGEVVSFCVEIDEHGKPRAKHVELKGYNNSTRDQDKKQDERRWMKKLRQFY